MNNPFVNFDLEESLAGLPAALRQPMVLAVAASGLVHGLFFLVLPVVTNSTESKKLPDRIVGVVELTPEQQAKLPPSMMINQLPLAPTAPTGKLPMTSLFPGALPNTGIKTTPPKTSIDALMDDIARDAATTSNSPYVAPIQTYAYTPVTPPVKEKTEAEKKAEAEVEKKKLDTAVQKEIEAREEAKRKEEEAKKNTPPGSGVAVEPGQQPNGTTPLAPGTPANNGTPVDPAAQQRLIAATTYSATGTTSDEQSKVQGIATQTIQAQLDQQLQQANIPPDQRERISGALAMSAMDAIPPIPLNPIVPKLPPGTSLNFGNAAPPKEVVAIVQIYVDSDGNLLPFSIIKDQPQAIVLTRSSGFQYLDNQAKEEIKALIKQQPPKGEGFRALKYQVPFKVPQQNQA